LTCAAAIAGADAFEDRSFVRRETFESDFVQASEDFVDASFFFRLAIALSAAFFPFVLERLDELFAIDFRIVRLAVSARFMRRVEGRSSEGGEPRGGGQFGHRSPLNPQSREQHDARHDAEREPGSDRAFERFVADQECGDGESERRKSREACDKERRDIARELGTRETHGRSQDVSAIEWIGRKQVDQEQRPVDPEGKSATAAIVRPPPTGRP